MIVVSLPSSSHREVLRIGAMKGRLSTHCFWSVRLSCTHAKKMHSRKMKNSVPRKNDIVEAAVSRWRCRACDAGDRNVRSLG